MTQTQVDPGEDRPANGYYLVLLALLRIAINLGLSWWGVVALSDDDYSRVLIAQRFAAQPRFDPSGTSWLPFPFWVNGAVMKLFDPSLEVARSTATALAVASAWLLFAAGRLWGFSRKQAFIAAAAANLLPVAAVLGSMTVPELPTAALSAFALTAVVAPRRAIAPAQGEPSESHGWKWLRDRARLISPVFLGGGAMLAATLSRYEAWPVAAVVAGVAGRRRDEATWKRLIAVVLPFLGPLLWIIHNKLAHDDAFSFVRRVARYRAALGPTQAAGATNYFFALVGGSPAVTFALVVLLFMWLRGRSRTSGRADLKPLLPWALGCLALFFFLLAGQLAGGAPTHHPERALLLVWLLATFAVVDLGSRPRAPLWLAVPIVVLFGLDARRQLSDPGASRPSEEMAGIQLRSLVPRGERVVLATKDYAYFAVAAAFGRPFDTIIDAAHDPRVQEDANLLTDHWNAAARVEAEGASWLVAPSSVVMPLALRERSRVGYLAIYELARTR